MQNPRECALDVLIKVDKKEELSHRNFKCIRKIPVF